ncbi:MAG: antibiotic biosynthesis monooxygenase [Tildeniella nuda ZEHNDER 1965/U140]|jgi:quinol monooxygenase YgiN|nr:antibiotic biosynthesis monooxygenase [Tildeniella nuda ZEHNDER 1965/U140]
MQAQTSSNKHLLTVAKLTIKPDEREAFISASNLLSEPSRTEEGCVSWEYFQDTTDPNTFVFIEEWTGKEAFDFHFHTEHFQKYLTLLRARWLTKPFSVRQYTIDATEVATVTPTA